MSACGTDAYYFQNARQKLRYGPFQDMLDFDFQAKSCRFQERDALIYNQQIAQMVDGIIPVMYDYECGYSELSNLKTTIPLPLNAEKYQCSDNVVGEKVVIFPLSFHLTSS